MDRRRYFAYPLSPRLPQHVYFFPHLWSMMRVYILSRVKSSGAEIEGEVSGSSRPSSIDADLVASFSPPSIVVLRGIVVQATIYSIIGCSYLQLSESPTT